MPSDSQGPESAAGLVDSDPAGARPPPLLTPPALSRAAKGDRMSSVRLWRAGGGQLVAEGEGEGARVRPRAGAHSARGSSRGSRTPASVWVWGREASWSSLLASWGEEVGEGRRDAGWRGVR